MAGLRPPRPLRSYGFLLNLLLLSLPLPLYGLWLHSPLGWVNLPGPLDVDAPRKNCCVIGCLDPGNLASLYPSILEASFNASLHFVAFFSEKMLSQMVSSCIRSSRATIPDAHWPTQLLLTAFIAFAYLMVVFLNGQPSC